MDIFTLVACTAVISLCMALTLFSQFLVSKTERYLIDWIIAAVCFFMSNGVGFFILLAVSPSNELVALANALYSAAYAAILSGVYRLCDGQRIRKFIPIMFMFVASLHLFPFVMNSVDNRLLIFYSLAITVYSVAVVKLWKCRKRSDGKSFFLLILTLSIFIAQLLARGLFTLMETPDLLLIGNHFVQTSGTLFLILFLFMLTISCSSIVMWRKELSLRKLAVTDELTGWLNRKSLDKLASDEVKKSRKLETDLSFILLDIDFFKEVNDKYGHAFGDEALCQVCDLAKHMKRETDHHFRIGGEEFLIIASATSIDTANVIADRIRQAVQENIMMIDSVEISLTLSFGIATLQATDNTWQDVLRRADKALYLSKNSGRNRVSLESEVNSILAAELSDLS